MTTRSEAAAVADAEGLRRRRLEPDLRREQILACAIRLFGERPYAAVSTVDIAREAGVARGLLNHYFGTKRDLYLDVVRRMVLPDEVDLVVADTASLPERVEACVEWFLDAVSEHGKTFVAVTGSEGVGDDPEMEKILFEADDVAAQRVLDAVGLGASAHDEQQRAIIRAYGGMAKASIREWVRHGSLTRADLKTLLSATLTSVVSDVLPVIASTAPPARKGRAATRGVR